MGVKGDSVPCDNCQGGYVDNPAGNNVLAVVTGGIFVAGVGIDHFREVDYRTVSFKSGLL